MKIRVTYNRVVKRISTNIFVRKEDLTKSFKIKNTIYKLKVEELIKEYQELATGLPIDSNTYTIDEIIEYINKKEEVVMK